MDAPKPTRSFRRPLLLSMAVIAVALLAAAGWWMSGHKVWTDGRSGSDAIRVSTSNEDPRQVLWTPSRKVLPGSAAQHDYEPALSPDGTELFFVRGKAGLPVEQVAQTQPATGGADIYVSRRRNNNWSEATPLAGVNGRYDDLGPRMTADGRFLLFYSNRPGGQGGYDLWAAARNEDGSFAEPLNLGAGINSEFDEYSPAPTPDGGRLYFSTNRTAAAREQKTAWRATIRAATTGDFDLWLADLNVMPSATLLARNAREVPALNTAANEGAPCISSAGDFLYFASNRTGGIGKFDLYRSRLISGEPSQPENLGPSINTANNEADPQLAFGGFRLYYSSDRETSASPASQPSGSAEMAGPAVTDGAIAPHTQPAGAATNPSELAEARSAGYDIYEADSREVFPDREPRPLPTLGLRGIAMLAGLIALLPLLFFLVRNINRRNLSLLQRCFLAALAVYALFLFWTTSKHVVMESYPTLAKELGLIEVAINLDPQIEESNVAMAIRQQSTNDLPAPAAPAGQLQQQVVGSEIIAAAPDVAVQVPQAAVGGDAMTVAVSPPKIELSNAAPTPAMPTVAPVVSPSFAPVDLKIDAGQRLQAAELQPVIQPAQAPAATPAPAAPQAFRPAAVPMPELPAVQPVVSAGSLAQEIGPVRPSAPAIEPAVVAVPPQPMQGATPTVQTPAPMLNRAVAPDPMVPPVDTSIANTLRITPALPAPSAAAVQTDLPKPVLPPVTLNESAAPAPAPPSSPARIEVARPAMQALAIPATSVPIPTVAPPVAGAKLTTVEAAFPSNPAGSSIDRLAPGGTVGAAPSADLKSIVPAAGALTGGATTSLAATPGVSSKRAQEATDRIAGVSPNIPAGDLLKSPEAAGPKMALAPVAGGEPQTSIAGVTPTAGLAKQDSQNGAMAGGAGIRSPLLPALPTTGGSPASLADVANPAAAARAVASLMNGPTNVQPAATAIAVGNASPVVTSLQAPATRPSITEPSLASAIVAGSAATTQPTRAAASFELPSASVAPASANSGPTADTTKTSLASAPGASATNGVINAADVRIAGPTVGNPAGAAAMVQSPLNLSTPRPAYVPVAAATPELLSSPSVGPAQSKRDRIPSSIGDGAPTPPSIMTATPAAPSVEGKTGGAITSAAIVAPRSIVVSPAVPAPSVAGAGAGRAIAGVQGPRIELPKVGMAIAPGNGQGSPIGVGSTAGGGPDGAAVAAARSSNVASPLDRPMLLSAGSVPGVGPRMSQQNVGGPTAAVVVRPELAVTPNLSISPSISIASPKVSAPAALFQRSPEQRRPMIEKLGGTKESENAVDRGLAYLAREQEADGRWTYIGESGKKSKKREHEHDMALTGLSVLAFLAADHSPVKEGPYRQTVARGVDWLVAQQTEDGDLRGPKSFRGSGSGRANMYDHGIAAMAVAEAALMTGDRRYTESAMKAAQFICDRQHAQTGGWRYSPGESGDTSVFGWQIMALHNAELLGFATPPQVRSRSNTYLSLVSSGRSKILAGYTPREGATPPMTAEALFCRILLGQPINAEQAKEVVEYLNRDMPKKGNADLYYWYYASLSMSQLQANPQVRVAWDKWNERCRDTLIALQAKGGDQDGSWTDSKWGQHGGKVFSTALATLTLEVYYRYLPIDGSDPTVRPPAEKLPKPRGPVGPKFEAN